MEMTCSQGASCADDNCKVHYNNNELAGRRMNRYAITIEVDAKSGITANRIAIAMQGECHADLKAKVTSIVRVQQ